MAALQGHSSRPLARTVGTAVGDFRLVKWVRGLILVNRFSYGYLGVTKV